MNSDRYGLRGERLFLPARLCLPDTAPASRCRSLRLHLHSQTLFDGSASLRCQPETSACFSEPSMPGCRTPSYLSHVSHTARHILPTHKRKKPTTFYAHGSSVLSVCDADPLSLLPLVVHRSFLANTCGATRYRSYLRWCHAHSSLYLRCLFVAEGRMLSASIILPTRNVSIAMAFDRSLRQSLASPVIADSEHRCSRLRFAPL